MTVICSDNFHYHLELFMAFFIHFHWQLVALELCSKKKNRKYFLICPRSSNPSGSGCTAKDTDFWGLCGSLVLERMRSRDCNNLGTPLGVFTYHLDQLTVLQLLKGNQNGRQGQGFWASQSQRKRTNYRDANLLNNSCLHCCWLKLLLSWLLFNII